MAYFQIGCETKSDERRSYYLLLLGLEIVCRYERADDMQQRLGPNCVKVWADSYLTGSSLSLNALSLCVSLTEIGLAKSRAKAPSNVSLTR